MQLQPEDGEPDALVQNVETGGVPADDADTNSDPDTDDVTDALASLEQAEAHEVRTTLAKAQTLESRLPDHAAALKRQAARTLGCEVADLEPVLDETPSDPRLV
ncbi:hypothetical protein [Natrinema sp. SYSU A 869]|uniref:hypothetical protein n=1 Tax=Natrinema sp. SYSU A 869 TaxID=2871694 RepID=UPI001CA43B87|nr:hypothetical protein [Natrinema sp. SYSU A 869]